VRDGEYEDATVRGARWLCKTKNIHNKGNNVGVHQSRTWELVRMVRARVTIDLRPQSSCTVKNRETKGGSAL
jgi:hypothetical protein